MTLESFERRRAHVLLLAVASIVSVAAVEMLSRVVVWRGDRAYHQYRVTPYPTFWMDISPACGMWHPANATFHHAEQCWDVTYHTNSYGARDAERSRRSSASRRHVVLGDSFIEGYGLPDGQRLTDRLNASTAEEFLNFGEGEFGTVQELMLYRSLVSSFDHSDVVLFVLPDNDFMDNDPKYYPRSRYRPYLRHTNDGDEVYYTVKFDERDRHTLGRAMLAWNWMSNHVYLMNLTRQAVERRLRSEVPRVYTSYEGHSRDELETMAAAIRELAAAARPRPVHVFMIPLQVDLDAYLDEGKRFQLPDRLRASLRDVQRVDLVDLLPDFLQYVGDHHVPTSAFYLKCDAHWGPIGNAVAAEAVWRHLH